MQQPANTLLLQSPEGQPLQLMSPPSMLVQAGGSSTCPERVHGSLLQVAEPCAMTTAINNAAAAAAAGATRPLVVEASLATAGETPTGRYMGPPAGSVALAPPMCAPTPDSAQAGGQAPLSLVSLNSMAHPPIGAAANPPAQLSSMLHGGRVETGGPVMGMQGGQQVYFMSAPTHPEMPRPQTQPAVGRMVSVNNVVQVMGGGAAGAPPPGAQPAPMQMLHQVMPPPPPPGYTYAMAPQPQQPTATGVAVPALTGTDVPALGNPNPANNSTIPGATPPLAGAVTTRTEAADALTLLNGMQN